MDETTLTLLNAMRGSPVSWLLIIIGIALPAWLRRARPTGRAFALMLLPVPLLILSILFPWLSSFGLFYTPLLMLAILLDAFMLSPAPENITLERIIHPRIGVGQRQPVRIRMLNRTPFPVNGEIRDDAPTELLPEGMDGAPSLPVIAPPFAEETVAYDLLPTRRGPFAFGRIYLRYRSRLGLLWLGVKSGAPETVAVTPDLRWIRRIRIFASRSQAVGESQKRALGLEGTQFSGLRHYFTGDDVRKMAWQAAAKLDMPIVRTFTPEVEQPVMVLIDAGRKMTVPARDESGKALLKYDWALNTALAFASVALDRGDRVGAGIFSNRVLARVMPGRGRTHMRRLLRVLGESEPERVDPDYESVMLQFSRGLKRRTLVVLLTDLIDPAASRSLLKGLRQFAAHHLLLVVTLSDGALMRLADDPGETAYDIYRRGMAMDMLELRRQTLQTISHSRQLLLVDAPPDVLDEALVRRYVEIKTRGYF